MSDLDCPWNLEFVPSSHYGFAMKMSSHEGREKDQISRII